MASEDIKVQNGRLVVERAGNKQNVDVPVSDVDSVSFHRGGEVNGASDGSLVLHTKNGDVVIRVADDEAGKALKVVYGALESPKETKKAAPKDDSANANSETK